MSVQDGDARRLLGIQGVLTVAVAALFLARGGVPEAQAALYGGSIAMLTVWMSSRRVRLATEVARRNPGGETAVLYIGAVQRFVAVLALFILGMGWLELAPVPLLAGFAAGQAAFFLVRGVGTRSAARQAKNGVEKFQ